MTLMVYLPPGMADAAYFLKGYPSLSELFTERGVDAAPDYWEEGLDLVGKPPGIVFYNSVCTHTSLEVMVAICDNNHHLCLYNCQLIVKDNESIAGNAIREFVSKWLDEMN